MKGFDWRSHIISIVAIALILLYVALFVADLVQGKGLENLGVYIVMSICLALAIGAKIMPPRQK